MSKPKCGCSWIDGEGNPTPDNNEAIGLAVCYDPRSFGEKGSDPFPICAEHAGRKGKWWKILPFEGEDPLKTHEIVIRDHVNFPEKVPTQTVIDSIKKSFPKDAMEILDSLRFDHIMKCFYFTRWGMFVGVELDGFIHS